MARPVLLAATAIAAGIVTAAASAGPAQDYTLYCMGCHGAQAQGVPGKIPPLAGALARFMRTPEGRNYVLRVPGAANSALADAQLAAVLNWLAERYSAPDEPRPLPWTRSHACATPPLPTCWRRVARWYAASPRPARRPPRITDGIWR